MTTESFSSYNSWHFAAARDFVASRHSTSVLCERRILDGAVIAEWDHGKGTGWMRSVVTPIAVPATDDKAMNLSESFRSSLLDLTVASLAPAVAKTAGAGGVKAKDIVACAYKSLRGGSDATYVFVWHDGDAGEYCVSTCVMVSMAGDGIKCQSVGEQPEDMVEDKAKAISIMKALAAKG